MLTWVFVRFFWAHNKMNGENKMKSQIAKTKLSAIIVIVLMVTSITLLALPVQAQEEGHGGYTE